MAGLRANPLHLFSYFWIGIIVCLFAANTSNSAEFRFVNSKTKQGWVIFSRNHKNPAEQPGLYWFDGKQLRLEAAGNVFQIAAPQIKKTEYKPILQLLLQPIKSLKNSEKKAHSSIPSLVEINNQIFLLWANGKKQELLSPNMIKFTFDTTELDHTNTNALDVVIKSFVSDGRQYAVVVNTYIDKLDGQRISDLILIREDGIVLTQPLAIGPWQDSINQKISIDDGILSIKNSIYKFDLRQFEAEANRERPLKSLKIADEEGKLVSAVDIVKNYFPDLMEDNTLLEKAYRNDPKEFAPLIEAYYSTMIGSVAALGPAGVGKTEFLKSFFAAIKRGEVPGIPRTIWVPYVDLVAANAGTKFAGVFESRVAALLAVAQVRETVLFMDEMHSVRGAGTHDAQSNDIFQSFKPLLASGKLRIFGTDTQDEFDAAFSGDVALSQRFARITRNEFDEQKTLTAIESFFKKTSSETPKPEVLRYIYRLANEFNAVDANPRKANRLADKLQARFKIAKNPISSMTMEDVAAAAQELYEVDPAHFTENGRREKLGALRSRLDEYLVGHEQAKDLVTDLTLQSYVNTHDDRRPRLRMLLAGDRGLGKTEFGFAYARALGYRFHRIEMNRFEDGSLGADDLRREVASELSKNAFTVFLVDEIEKAPLSVQNAMLGIMDDGIFSVRQKISQSQQTGVLVRASARNASFILTTNAGKHLSYSQAKSGGKLGFALENENASSGPIRKTVETEITQDGLSPFLVDRMQAVLIFKGFTKQQFRSIVGMHLKSFFKEQMQKRGKDVTLPIDQELVIDRITEEFYHPKVSGREALRAIQDRIRSWYAKAIFENRETDSVLCELLLFKK